MERLNIFVSSTCYDLTQIRTDLYEFIDKSGHVPVLSEFNSFPIDPQRTTIENCIEAVKKSADLLVLIIGNRYGSVIESGKSITNTEYLTAKSKGIPIFIFLDKRITTALDFWNENKGGNFDKFVDNTQIFDFVSDIRTNSKSWTFTFENAQHITETLKVQMSYLFKDALKIKTHLDVETFVLDGLPVSNQALKILFEKERYYEYHFFSQVFIDEIKKKEQKKNDFKYTIYFEPKSFLVKSREILQWSKERMHTLQSLVNSLDNLIKQALKDYINELGKPSDLRGLYYVAFTYAKLFESFMNWIIDTHNTIVPKECEEIKEKLAMLPKGLVDQIWEYPFVFYQGIQELIHHYTIHKTDSKVNLTINFSYNKDDYNELNEAIDKFGKILLQK